MAFSSTPGRGTAAASGTAPAMAGTALGASSRRAPCAPSRSMRVAAALPPAVRTGAGTPGTHPASLEPDAGAGRAFAFRDWKTPAARSRRRLARRAMPARPCRAVTAPATPGRPRTPPFAGTATIPGRRPAVRRAHAEPPDGMTAPSRTDGQAGGNCWRAQNRPCKAPGRRVDPNPSCAGSSAG